LGVVATIGEKNDIRINDLKISGNAEHVYRKRVLHHGTLLFNSNLEQLRNAIKVSEGRYFDKAVQSNRSPVTNIIDHLHEPMPIDRFSEGLKKYIFTSRSQYTEYQLTKEDLNKIEELRLTKYATPEWIYGYSPRYLFYNEFTFAEQNWKVELNCEQGIIISAEIAIDEHRQKNLETLLNQIPHRYEPLEQAIQKFFTQLSASEISKLCYQFF